MLKTRQKLHLILTQLKPFRRKMIQRNVLQIFKVD